MDITRVTTRLKRRRVKPGHRCVSKGGFMKLMKLFMAGITILLLASCYEMKEDKKGRTVKVNKLTGEMFVIEDDKIIKLKGEKEVKAEQEAAKQLGEPKRWPEIPLNVAGGTNARFITKWNDGNMYYQFFIDKNLRGKGNYFARLTIQLHDNASFLIEEIPVPVSNMTGSLGLDGKTVESMEYKGQIPMSDETYKKISEWNVSWAGFNK
jgi:hypothetical protein